MPLDRNVLSLGFSYLIGVTTIATVEAGGIWRYELQNRVARAQRALRTPSTPVMTLQFTARFQENVRERIGLRVCEQER